MATIEKRGSSYRIMVSNGYDINGKQIREKMTWTPEPGMTERQIQKELNRQATLFEERCITQQVHGGSIKLSDFAEQWLNDYGEEHLKAATLAVYRSFLPRINAALGHIKLEKLQPRHLVSFYANLEEPGVRLDTKYKSKADFKQLLAQREYTQASFCRQFSIGHGIVEALCVGKNISAGSAEKVASALGSTIPDLFDTVDRGSLSGKTRLHYHRFLSSMLETAVQWQMIPQNPCKRIKPPRADSKETAYLDETQAVALISALNSEPIQYRAIILTLLNTGLRRGELCGLCWDDLDLAEAVLSVRRNAVYISGKGVTLDTPKTRSSLRSIKIPQSIVHMLKQYRAWQCEQRLMLGDLWHNNNLVFPSWDGNILHPDSLTNWFGGFIRRHNLPHISIHGLRHTNATLLIAAGTNLRTVSGRLGHSQASTTANIYAHAIRSADAAAAEALDDILSPIKKQA